MDIPVIGDLFETESHWSKDRTSVKRMKYQYDSKSKNFVNFIISINILYISQDHLFVD